MGNAKAWLHSIIAAAIGGAATSLSAILIAPANFNFSHSGLVNLGQVALAGAVIPVLALLKQSPLPASEQTVTTSVSQTTAVTETANANLPGGAGIKSGPVSSIDKLNAWALIAVLLMGSMAAVSATGCTQSQVQETENIVNVIVGAAANLAAVAAPGAAWALALPAALAGLKTAEAGFVAGTSTGADVSNASLAIEDILAAIKPGSEESDLADVLTTAIDSLLAVLPVTSSTSALTGAGSWHRTVFEVTALRIAAGDSQARYNHHGRAKIGHLVFRSHAGDFKAAWNKAVARHPALAKAKL